MNAPRPSDTQNNRTVYDMKKILIIAAVCLLPLFAAKAEEVVYPGNPAHPEFGNSRYFDYDSVLIRLIQKMNGSAASRQAVVTRIKEHSEEVNDRWCHDGWSGTPLTEAIRKKDKEIVSLLLAHGAIPFPPPGVSFWTDYAEGKPQYAEIFSLIKAAQKKYPVYSSILSSDVYRKQHSKK